MSKFKILSLDGGGIRGAFSAAFLATLEKSVGAPLGRYFDLIVGTSTGGIIATALALGISAERVSLLYQEEGARIFARQAQSLDMLSSRWHRLLARIGRWLLNPRLAPHDMDVDGFLQSKFHSRPLEEVLRSVFGTRKIGDAQVRLALPVIDLAAGRVMVLKTPHLPHASSRDRSFDAVDAVLGTTAAPTYFPHATIGAGSALCDGGLWANNPSVVAYAEALKIRECCQRPGIDPLFNVDEIMMLSVGTGKTVYSLAPPRRGAGLGWWAPRLINVTLLSQAQGMETLAQYLMGPTRHHRVNYVLPDPTWRLDNLEHLERLANNGYLAGHDNLSALRPIFFDEPAPRYTPFPELPGLGPGQCG